MGKPFWASKTIWVNALAVVAAISGAFGLDLGLTPETQMEIVVAIMAVANIALRFITSSKISG